MQILWNLESAIIFLDEANNTVDCDDDDCRESNGDSKSDSNPCKCKDCFWVSLIFPSDMQILVHLSQMGWKDLCACYKTKLEMGDCLEDMICDLGQESFQ